jgi:hypothetical protein
MCSLHDDRDPRISIVKQERLFLAAARETSRRALNCRSLVKRATEMIRRGAYRVRVRVQILKYPFRLR